MNKRKLCLIALVLAVILAGTGAICVQASARRIIPVAKASARIVMMPLKATVNVGDTLQLTAKVNAAVTDNILWTVDRGASVGSVDENGVVTGLKAGNVYIRATDKVSGRSAQRKVVVKAVRVKQVTLAHSSIVIDIGETFNMPAPDVQPANATVKTPKWTSGKKRVAAVDETGRITGVSGGTTRIYCTVGNKKVSCKVRVRGQNTTITLSAVGDVILGGDPTPKCALNRSTEEVFAKLITQYGEGYPFKNVASILKSDDITIANLEGTLTTSKSSRAGKSHVFRGDPGYARMLKNAGIEVCNLANNHTLDFKERGLLDTKKSLDAVGVRYCDFTENGTYTVIKDGLSIKIGFAGFQTPTKWEDMTTRIKALKKKCDVVVVSFHWCDTKEWVSKNYESDRRRAKYAIAAGADLVLGHHRHVPAGIETYRGKYIVYDLSNFVAGIKHKADEQGRLLSDSLIFQWTFRIDSLGIIEDVGIGVIPCTTTTSTETYPATDGFGDLGAPINNFQPDVLTGKAAQDVMNRIRAMSTIEVPMG